MIAQEDEIVINESIPKPSTRYFGFLKKIKKGKLKKRNEQAHALSLFDLISSTISKGAAR